jgi:hypothetical protein
LRAAAEKVAVRQGLAAAKQIVLVGHPRNHLQSVLYFAAASQPAQVALKGLGRLEQYDRFRFDDACGQPYLCAAS